MDLGPACRTWGWHTWAVPEQPSWLRVKLHLEQLGGLSVRLPVWAAGGWLVAGGGGPLGTNAPLWLLPAAPLMPTGAACPAEGIVEDKSCRKLYNPNENNPGTARELIACFLVVGVGVGRRQGASGPRDGLHALSPLV